MLPAIVWLRAAPMPTAVVMAPSVRLKRPVPLVRSAITSTETTPKIPTPTPSKTWMATSKGVSDVRVNRTPRIGSAAKPMSSSGFRPHDAAFRPDQEAISVTTNWVVTAKTALLLAKALDTTPQFWLNLQNACDLGQAERNVGSP